MSKLRRGKGMQPGHEAMRRSWPEGSPERDRIQMRDPLTGRPTYVVVWNDRRGYVCEGCGAGELGAHPAKCFP